jgi:hypothetical protein
VEWICLWDYLIMRFRRVRDSLAANLFGPNLIIINSFHKFFKIRKIILFWKHNLEA